MRIAILGAGALGCAIGGTLAEAGVDVVLLSRDAPHVEAMQQRGLTLRGPRGDRVVPVRAASDCAGLAPVDLVVVLVKSYHTEAAIREAAPLVGPGTLVMSLQNGMGHEDVLAVTVGRDRVLGGKTYLGGVLLGPGHVIAGTAGKETVIGELDGRISERAERVAATFRRAGLETVVTGTIMATIWDKLLINVATGAVSAISRLPYGALYRCEPLHRVALEAVGETIAVAVAAGVRLSRPDPEAAWRKAAEGLPDDFKASMLQSLEQGQPTEIDFINGAVVRAGERYGVPTPVNRTLVACVKGIEQALDITRATP